MFDKLLVLSEGREVYFGDIGPNSQMLTSYFKRSGARACSADENPAEWLLTILDSKTLDWPELWTSSSERQKVLQDIAVMKSTLAPLISSETTQGREESPVPFIRQLYIVTSRVLRHDWRSPSYLWSKTLCTFFIVRPSLPPSHHHAHVA